MHHTLCAAHCVVNVSCLIMTVWTILTLYNTAVPFVVSVLSNYKVSLNQHFRHLVSLSVFGNQLRWSSNDSETAFTCSRKQLTNNKFTCRSYWTIFSIRNKCKFYFKITLYCTSRTHIQVLKIRSSCIHYSMVHSSCGSRTHLQVYLSHTLQ